MEECILHQVPSFIEMLIVATRLFSILFRRDDRFHISQFGLYNNVVGVVPAIRQKVLGRKAVNQCNCLSAICCCALCNNSPERHTMRIHGQMQFCVEPPFV